jgi:Tol biopolymer transport system component
VPRGSRWVPVVGLVLALLSAPAFAQATLVYLRKPLSPVVWVAEDNGKHARELAPGSNPRVSPDGKTVAYIPTRKGSFSSELVVVPAEGGTPRRLLANWRDPFIFDWSPDSSTIAALRGPEIGKQTLVLIDVATGKQEVVATGFFSGVSFAPRGGQLVFARATSERFPPRSDVYRFEIPIGQSVRYVPPVVLTHDHRSTSPLWGPNGKIVFVKLLGAKRRRFGPKNELYLMNEAGGRVRRLTHTKVDPLLQGLYPTAWSANGKRLLCEFEGQDTTYAVTVNPQTGAQRPLIQATEQGFLGTGLSADGKQVLGKTGGFEPGPGADVGIVAYNGKPSVLVLAHNAFEPSWSQ